MLVCNVSQGPPRRAIAAGIAEAGAAADTLGTGNVVFATLVDDPASVGEVVDAYLGEIMLEAATAADVADASLPVVYTAAVSEAATAADAPTATVAASAWTPADLGAVVRAWYKFDTLTGSNGSSQGTLTDYSGNGFTLSQGSPAGQATLAVAEQNSLNTLRFNPSGGIKFFDFPSGILTGASAGSCYLVYKVVNDTSVNNGLMDWGSSATDNHWPFSDGVLYNDFGATVRKTVGNPTPVLTTYRIISIYSAVNDWAFYIDGGAGGSSGGTSPFFSTATNTVGWRTSQSLGKNTGNAALDGYITEIVFTNAKQTTSDRQKMEGYLAWKWGLAGNLDSTHPYKSAAPT